MRECFGCFKVARDPTACIACNYINATELVEKLAVELPPELHNLPQDLLDEARYEIMCHLPQFKAEEAKSIMQSGLATIIGKCADTALYLPKKRNEDLDDLKIILFHPEFSEAFVTNGDVVIRMSDIPPEVLDGLNPDIPAYDYLAERFIPNPLPYSISEMAQAFFNEFTYSLTIPIHETLDWMHRKYPDAVERRGTFTVLDVGYGMYTGSLIIPQFSLDTATGHKICQLGHDLIAHVSKDSVIPEEGLEPGVSYVGTPVADVPGGIVLNIYKKYSCSTTLGLFKILSPALSDDIHPFNLEAYAVNDKMTFELVPEIGQIVPREVLMRTFADFKPITLETEYLFHTLLLMGAFGYDCVTLHVRNSTDDPILIEGIKCISGQPTIEAVMATVQIGEDGRKCEIELENGPMCTRF